MNVIGRRYDNPNSIIAGHSYFLGDSYRKKSSSHKITKVWHSTTKVFTFSVSNCVYGYDDKHKQAGCLVVAHLSANKELSYKQLFIFDHINDCIYTKLNFLFHLMFQEPEL